MNLRIDLLVYGAVYELHLPKIHDNHIYVIFKLDIKFFKQIHMILLHVLIKHEIILFCTGFIGNAFEMIVFCFRISYTTHAKLSRLIMTDFILKVFKNYTGVSSIIT